MGFADDRRRWRRVQLPEGCRLASPDRLGAPPATGLAHRYRERCLGIGDTFVQWNRGSGCDPMASRFHACDPPTPHRKVNLTMKLHSLIPIGILAVTCAHTSFAQEGKSRAQVRAELDEAIHSGSLLAPGELGLRLNQERPDRYPAMP